MTAGAMREISLGEYVAQLPEGHRARLELAGLREQLQTEREAGLSAYDACGLRGAYWHVVECLARRDEELERIYERRQPLTVDAATDNAEPAVVRLALLGCLRAWEPTARVLGNVRAWDAERAIIDMVDRNAAHEREIERLTADLAETQEAMKHASRLIVKGAERQGALQNLIERLENEMHDGGILPETLADVHRFATDEPRLGRSEITRILDGESIDDVLPHPFDARLELRILGDLAHQLLSTSHGRRYDPAVTRTLERLRAFDMRVRALPPPVLCGTSDAADRGKVCP